LFKQLLMKDARNFLSQFCQHYLQRNTKVGLKIPILGEFKGTSEILSIHNILCRKLQLSVPHNFFTHDAAADEVKKVKKVKLGYIIMRSEA